MMHISTVLAFLPKRRSDLYYNTIGFLLTNRCKIGCQVCCYSCRNDNHTELPIEKIMDCIDQARGERHIRHIAISGGDPFLCYEKLIEIISYSKRNNFETSCYTNASWCTSNTKTEKILNELQEAGLDILRISIDCQHSKHIPVGYYKRLLEKIRKYNIKVFINTGILGNDLLKNTELISSIGKETVFGFNMQIFPFSRIGDAAKMDEELFFRALNLPDLKCPRNPILLIDAFGNVFACEMCLNNSYSVGNIFENELHMLIQKAKTEPYYLLVKKEGVVGVAKAMENAGISAPFPFVTSCEFCNWVFSNIDKMELERILTKAGVSDG